MRKEREQASQVIGKAPSAKVLKDSKRKKSLGKASTTVIKANCSVPETLKNTPSREKEKEPRTVTPVVPHPPTVKRSVLEESSGAFHFGSDDSDATEEEGDIFESAETFAESIVDQGELNLHGETSFLDQFSTQEPTMTDTKKLQAEITALKTKIGGLEATVENFQINERNYKKKFVQQKTLIDTLSGAGEHGHMDEPSLKKKYADLQTELENLKSNYSDLQNTLTQTKKEEMEAKQREKTLYVTATDQNKKNTALLKNVADLQKKVADLQKKVADLKGKSVSNESTNPMEIVAFQLQVDTLKKELDDVKKERDALQAKLDANRSTSGDDDDDQGMDSLEYQLLKKKCDEWEKKHNALEALQAKTLEQRDECLKICNKHGQSPTFQANKTVLEKARAYLKEVTFRKIKFAEKNNPAEVKAMMRDVYDGIKVDNQFEVPGGKDELSFDNFFVIYKQTLTKYMGTLRSTANTNSQKACLGKCI